MKEFRRSDLRIAVLAGGRSNEREISLASGANVLAALKTAGFGSVVMFDPASPKFLTDLPAYRADAAFIAMHGEGGEDGKIQSVLDWMGVPYTGSGVTASACAADKDLSKLLYTRAGVPVAPGVALTAGEEYSLSDVLEVCGDHCFVKPAVNGSSYGITYVKQAEDLKAAIDYAFEFGDKVLVEKKVEGTEVTVGVFEDEEGSLRSLPIVEILKQEDAEFFDLRVKYISPDKIHRIPAQISEPDYARASELAIAAHRALGCTGISRSDFIVSKDGPVILETNTIPGMTDTSLYPDEVRHTDDLQFSEVCAALVALALNNSSK